MFVYYIVKNVIILNMLLCIIDVIGEVLDFGGMDVVHTQRKQIKKVEFTVRDIK